MVPHGNRRRALELRERRREGLLPAQVWGWRSRLPELCEARRNLCPVLACALLLGGGGGCQAGLSARRLRQARAAVAEARDAGAYLCAPRELALAQAHVEFAETAEIHGDVERGRFHLGEAQLNAKAAHQLSSGSGCSERGGAGAGSSPALADRDGDGVVDQVDLCPDEPEDWDNYLDEDGCAEEETVAGTFSDGEGGSPCSTSSSDPKGRNSNTACPDMGGNVRLNDSDEICVSDYADGAHAGCVNGRYAGIEMRENAVILSDPLQFVGREAVLDEPSRLRASALARWLQERPALTLEVQGHLDSRGDAKENLRLSALRAQAVRALLVLLGVDAARLTTRGYGETRPLESNRTSQGRALNRRIEFVRTDTTH